MITAQFFKSSENVLRSNCGKIKDNFSEPKFFGYPCKYLILEEYFSSNGVIDTYLYGRCGVFRSVPRLSDWSISLFKGQSVLSYPGFNSVFISLDLFSRFTWVFKAASKLRRNAIFPYVRYTIVAVITDNFGYPLYLVPPVDMI